jgi:hypothetical protein
MHIPRWLPKLGNVYACVFIAFPPFCNIVGATEVPESPQRVLTASNPNLIKLFTPHFPWTFFFLLQAGSHVICHWHNIDMYKLTPQSLGFHCLEHKVALA